MDYSSNLEINFRYENLIYLTEEIIQDSRGNFLTASYPCLLFGTNSTLHSEMKKMECLDSNYHVEQRLEKRALVNHVLMNGNNGS